MKCHTFHLDQYDACAHIDQGSTPGFQLIFFFSAEGRKGKCYVYIDGSIFSLWIADADGALEHWYY